MNVLYPPNSLLGYSNPIIFLAGPIASTTDWQTKTIDLINGYDHSKDLLIANPRFRWTTGDKFTDEDFNKQTDWEHNHLSLAGRKGCILFWLANEDINKHICKRSYAQTSRYELAEAIAMKATGHYKNIVVGIDSEFSGKRYIERTIKKRCHDVTITTTLESTVDVAVRLLERNSFTSNGF